VTFDVTQSGERVDRFVAREMGVSRTEVQRWIDAERVTIDGQRTHASAIVRAGCRIDVAPLDARTTDLTPDASVPMEVLHVDDAIVVLVKPPGVVVHPAPGSEHGTLVHGLLARGLFVVDEDADEHTRPGIVHRLDKGTSGVMVVARTAEAREALKAQFSAHTIDREYVAICGGVARTATHRTLHGRDPRNRLRFTSRVRAGKARTAVTHVRLLETLAGGGASLVTATLETGRTHQIRVHLSEAGTPVLGDALYARRDLGKPRAEVAAVAHALGHQALHARLLGFVHPTTGLRVRFEAPPPDDFARALATLREL
jgi:23S rRNA pseudouridine1911/1915/1917 synthase